MSISSPHAVVSQALQASYIKLANISHNLANINTPAFKTLITQTTDSYYNSISSAGVPDNSVDNYRATPIEIGHGSKISNTIRDMTNGDPQSTNNPLDMMISGNGFFQVILADGTLGYTRKGIFEIDKNRRIVTQHGSHPLAADITIPPDLNVSKLSIANDGTITITDAAGNLTELANIPIYTFDNVQALGNLNGYLVATEESGEANENIAGQNGAGEIMQKSFEGSNVEIFTMLEQAKSTLRQMEALEYIRKLNDKYISDMIDSFKGSIT